MRIIKFVIEAALRFVASVLLIVLTSMLYNLYIYKSKALLALALIVVAFSQAIILLLKRRRLATSEEELKEMFPITQKLVKASNTWLALWVAFFVLAVAMNFYCAIILTEPYKGIDTQMADLYNVSPSAVSVMRSIPGTFAARAFYVVVTEMDNFDFDFYDSLLLNDYLLLFLVIGAALLWTVTANVKRYNLSVRNIKDANY